MNTDPSHDEISQHAYSLWEQRGRPDGQDSDIWLEAERNLRGRSPQSQDARSAASPGAPSSASSASPIEKARRAQRRDSDDANGRAGTSGSRSPMRAGRTAVTT